VFIRKPFAQSERPIISSSAWSRAIWDDRANAVTQKNALACRFHTSRTIPTGEQSLLLTHIAATETVSLCAPMTPRGWSMKCAFWGKKRSQKPAVVDADFLGDEIVEQAVHPQDELFVLLWCESQVVHFVGITLQIEKLDVVVLENLVQRLWRVERSRRVVAGELVTSIENKGEKATFVQLRRGQLRWRLARSEGGHDSGEVIGVDGTGSHVVEKDSGAHGMQVGFLWVGKQRREVVTRQRLQRRRPTRLRHPGQADEGGEEIQGGGEGGAVGAGLGGRMRDD